MTEFFTSYINFVSFGHPQVLLGFMIAVALDMLFTIIRYTRAGLAKYLHECWVVPLQRYWRIASEIARRVARYLGRIES